MEPLTRARRGLPCPVCHEENQKCSFTRPVPVGNHQKRIQTVLCVNVPSGKECGGKVIMQTWIHYLEDGQTVEFTPKERKPGCRIANREQRDQVYRAFLEMLKLGAEHWKKLILDKVPASLIIERGYKTVPEFKDRWRYAKQLLEQGFSLEGIPGFFQAESRGRKFWTLIAKEGYFIPVTDRDGFIINLRIRLDKPELNRYGQQKRKYRWLSSDGLLMGTGSGVECHVAMGETDEIYITEGERKADVVRYKTGKACISVPGVGTWRLALEIVQELSPKSVVIAYDMDKRTNPDVSKCEGWLIEALKKELPEVVVLKAEWDISQGKGIDDFLLSQGREPEKIAA